MYKIKIYDNRKELSCSYNNRAPFSKKARQYEEISAVPSILRISPIQTPLSIL